jgi:hypothetical protein
MADKAHTFTDNFNDNDRDSARWGGFGQNLIERQEVNQRLEIRPLPNRPSANYAGYSSKNLYDLTSSSITIEVVQVLNQVPGTETFLSAGSNDANRVMLVVSMGQIGCVQVVVGTTTTLAACPYDPAAHRWWRLRESHNTTWWEVSPDGERWTVLFSKNNPTNLASCVLTFGAGTSQSVAYPGFAIFDSFNSPSAGLSRRVEERRLSALGTRDKASRLAASRAHPEHANNNDETNYPDRPFVGNYSKSLKHDLLGDPDPYSYGTLLRALQSEDPGDFEEIVLAPPPATGQGPLKLTNPQAGYAFELEGPDTQAVTMPPAPRFDSDQTAAEMGELYWMALARDVSFSDYVDQALRTDSIIERAIRSLNTEFPQFGGTVPVTVQNLFRGIYPGEQVGPYVSQFLWKGNVDPRKVDTQGRDAAEGFITYGTQVIDQRQLTVRGAQELGLSADYLTNFTDWLDVQNGRDDRGKDVFDPRRRFIRNLRDGANYVHFDQVVNAFYNAAFYLLSEPRGDQNLGTTPGTGRPQADMEFSFNVGNPYDPPDTERDARKQVGFATFGPIHLLQALIEVAGRAGRAVWWQKWGVHRRLRPEEYGGRVHNHVTGRRTYPLSKVITTALSPTNVPAGAVLGPTLRARYAPAPPSYLLPQAYPEGAPTHPAYGAGHATISGACATLLKAFFNENALMENPLVANADGTALVPYEGSDATRLTVGGELNKLAGNISLFRDAAGVHWRSDYTDSLPLGEKVAIGLLQEMSLTFNEEDAFFQFTRFDGTTIRIHNGVVKPVSAG